jgi:hypothetical protein
MGAAAAVLNCSRGHLSLRGEEYEDIIGDVIFCSGATVPKASKRAMMEI